MKRSLFIILIIVLFVVPFLLFAQTQIPDKDITIKKSGDKKSAVTYNHTKHAKIDIAKDCKGCHDAVKTQSAAHKLCTGCHRKAKAGPVKCNDCHK